ncbi:MAG: sulfotransferase, partial [Candidatus Brocadiaceae bacterium]|nr:sulfotransferase [Candidatus Brocadiaceae bacterium]
WAQKTKKQYDDYFEDHDTMDVIYEDLSVNLESEVKHIQKFLRVPFEDVKPSTYKQSNQPLSTMILNYFELKRQFRNTPWEVFFED